MKMQQQTDRSCQALNKYNIDDIHKFTINNDPGI